MVFIAATERKLELSNVNNRVLNVTEFLGAECIWMPVTLTAHIPHCTVS